MRKRATLLLLAVASPSLLAGCGDIDLTNVGNCTQTRTIVHPTQAHAPADLVLSADLVTRDGEQPISGQKVEFFIMRSLHGGSTPAGIVTTSGAGRAELVLSDRYGSDPFLTPGVNVSTLVLARFQNPDLLTDDKVKKQRYCSSEGHAAFSYKGPVKTV